MKVHFPNTAFVTLQGADCHSFLKGVTTLDVDMLTDVSGTWGACLTPQGKIMFTFVAFMYEGKVYLQTTKDRLMDFGAWLSKYALNMKVEFSIGDNISVYGDTDVIGERGALSIQGDVLQLIDPRRDTMGAVLYAFNGKSVACDGDLEQYHAHRIKNGIIDFYTDYEQGKTFALECLLDKQNGVHYKKGCYIGQEVTARIHFKGSVKKHILPIECVEYNYAVGDEIISDEDKTMGKVLSVSGNHAMVMMRVGYIEAGTQKGNVKNIAPDWYYL